jgi:hypothetical protein
MRWLAVISGFVLIGVLALAAHIYFVTRPRVDGHSRGMARIDLHQKLGRVEADTITAWLSRQKGVDHVLVNPGTAIVVFTYLPATAKPGMIIKAFRDSLPFARAERYLPSPAEVRKGCPMTATPVTNGIYQFLKRLFQL